jgi:DNA-binding beta-propeller fold protein YncE
MMHVVERRTVRRCGTVGVAALSLLLHAASAAAFVTFESGQVRPLALSPDGSRVFAVDTPDDRLELFAVDSVTGNLTHSGTVPVGLEPVAVAARSNTEVWVHLNPHIDYCTVPSPPGTGGASLSTPVDMAITSDGSTLYVAAFGSSDPTRPGTGKVGVFSTAALEADPFTPSAASLFQIGPALAQGVHVRFSWGRI